MIEAVKKIADQIQNLVEAAKIDLQDYALDERLMQIQESLSDFMGDNEDSERLRYVLRAAKIAAQSAARYIESITELVDSFLSQYHPVSSILDCDTFTSSDELMNMFESVTHVSRSTVFSLMKRRGCKIVPIDGRFVWLLKEATPIELES